MIKYEVFLYDIWKDEDEDYVYGIFASSKCIYTDTSKASICKKLNLDDPYKIDVYDSYEGILYIHYEGKPYCELHEID